MDKAKLLYFTTFILVVMAFVFHITAMEFHHWKEARGKNIPGTVTIGLFSRCGLNNATRVIACSSNLFPNENCIGDSCESRVKNETCGCDYLPSTKGIAACAIIAAVFLGLAVILLFIQSINTTESRLVSIVFGFFPILLLLFTWIFILITIILVGSYLSRDIMYLLRTRSDCK